PTLNEEVALARTLPAILAQADEVVISDGGSTDRTLEVAAAWGARTVSGPPGRGGQLHRRAAPALDTAARLPPFPPAHSPSPEPACGPIPGGAGAGARGGAFPLRSDAARPQLRLGAWLTNQRTRLTRLPLGDQAHFVTKETFSRLGGFKEWPILEDLD